MLSDDLTDNLIRVAGLDRVILASDFDGVLAPLVDDPMSSRPAPGTMEALRAAARLPGTTVALVSGRDLATLRLLSGTAEDEPIVVIGSHGGESSMAMSSTPEESDEVRLTGEQTAVLEEMRTRLTEISSRYDGSHVEHKPAAVALHTRRMEDQVRGDEALTEALGVGQGTDGAHVIAGKCVVEITVLETSKGSALQRLAAMVDSEATIYLGDDVTDERAFAVLPAADGHVTIKVGAGDTLATHRIPDVPEVLAVFKTFLAARAGTADG